MLVSLLSTLLIPGSPSTDTSRSILVDAGKLEAGL